MNENEIYEIAQTLYEQNTEDHVLRWPNVDSLQVDTYRTMAHNVITLLDTIRENAAKGKS